MRQRRRTFAACQNRFPVFCHEEKLDVRDRQTDRRRRLLATAAARTRAERRVLMSAVVVNPEFYKLERPILSKNRRILD